MKASELANRSCANKIQWLSCSKESITQSTSLMAGHMRNPSVASQEDIATLHHDRQGIGIAKYESGMEGKELEGQLGIKKSQATPSVVTSSSSLR